MSDNETVLYQKYSRPNVYADLWMRCSKCEERIDRTYARGFKYCPYCGRKIIEYRE